MSADMGVSFATILRRYRLAAGLTQEELAARAHLSARAVSALEQGVNRAPRKETVELLAEALTLDPPTRASFVSAARRRAMPDGTSTRAADPLVGRQSELALLARHLSGEGPPALLLAGEPGIGKSRLLREAVEQARRYGWSVLSSGCQRHEGHVPFSPLVEALEQQLDRLSGVQRRAALQGCSGLERLLPELTGALHQEVPSWALPPDQERRLIFGAVRRFLANVAGPAGTLLVLDDLQWAHTDAIDLLATLLRAAEPVRVVAAYRNTEAPSRGPIATLVGELAATGLARHRLLSALSTDETRQLFEVTLSKTGNEGATLSERLLQRVGGLPFFIISWAQGLRRSPEQSEDALPWDVTASVRLRVAALPAEARHVLGAAAVVGREASRAVLAMAVGGSEEDLLTGLDVVCRAGLLVEVGETAYQFAHDVIREAVEVDLGAGRRAYLHQRIAEALETEVGEPRVDLLAYHYARSDAQARAVKYLALAAVKARAQYANVTAAGYYQELVERLERLVRPLEAAAARIQLGATLTAIARYDEASAVLEPAASVYQAAGDLEDLGQVIALIGQIHRLRPTPEEGLARIRPVLAGLQEAGPSEGLASLNMTLAHLCFAVGDYSGQLAAATRAADMARQVQANRLLADIEESRGSALIMMGQVDEGMRVVETAVPLAQAVNDLYTFGMAYWRLAKVHMLRGNWAIARQCAGPAREAAERLGDMPVAGGVVSTLGAVAFFSGDWAEARTFAAQFAAISDRLGFTWATPYVLIDQGRLSLAEGRDADARHLLEQAVRDAERIDDLQAIRYAANLLAARDLHAGRPMAARDRLAALCDRPGLQEPDVTALLPNLAWANLELGDTTQAATIAADAVIRARVIGYRCILIDALHVQTMMWLNAQAWDAAEIALAEGLSLARLLPYPYGEARLLEDEGLLHAYLGAFGTARGHLEAAAVIFRRLGARFDLERIEREVATLPELSRSDQRNC